MTIKRRNDWPERLAAYFEANRDTPFEFGVHDCGLFACGAVDAMAGTTLASELRGQYQDADGERSALEAIVRVCGIPAIPVKMARRGDIALCETSEGMTVMVVDGPLAYGPGELGIRTIPLSQCIAAWRIG